jgi:predicted dehydrogenase
MERVRVAIIGLGGVAQIVHLPNLSKIKNVEIKAVAEIKKSRLNAVADKFDIKERYTDFRELLEKSDIEAVIVATPTSSHKEIVIASLNAKKNVLVEKPIARTFAEANAMVQAAKKNKCKLMVGMNLRFRPDTMLLKTFINSGEIGDPFYARATWVRRQSSDEKWFMKKEESGGGVIFDLGISLLDLALWLMGYPAVKSLQTQTYCQNTKKLEDTAISYIRCDKSKLINIETSWTLPVNQDLFRISVFGSKGSVTTSPLHIYKRVDNQFVDLMPTMTQNSATLFQNSYRNELKSFIGAIQGLNPLFSSGERAVERLKVIDAMYRSAKKNQEIKVN